MSARARPDQRRRPRRGDRPPPGRGPRRGRRLRRAPRTPWARSPTVPSPSTAVPTTGCRGRRRSARHPAWRPCSTTRPCAPGSPARGNRHLSVPRGLMPVVAQRLDLGSRGGEWDWLWTRTAPPVGARRGARGGARPVTPRRGRGVPRRAQPAHPRAAVRAPGAALGGGARHRRPARSSPSAAASRAPRAPRRWPASRSRPTGAARAGAPRSPPTSPGWRSRDGCLRAGHVRRQRRRPAALPPAGLHDRDGVDLTLVRRLTSA